MLCLLQQHVQTHSGQLVHDEYYPPLYLLTQCLPILLLRWNSSLSVEHNSQLQRRWCGQFLRGNWISLYSEVVSALQSHNAIFERSVVFNPQSQPQAQLRRWEEAKEFVEAGCIGKARARILNCLGPHQSPSEILDNLRCLHPQESTPPPLPNLQSHAPDWVTGEWLARQIRSCRMRVAHDQFGWTMRETWQPLLAHEDILSSFAKAVFLPMAMGFQPPEFVPITIGGRLLGLPKPHKPGVRPICIGNVWRRLLAKGLLARQHVALEAYFLNHHPRVMQFCGGHANGATKLVQLLRTVYHAAMHCNSGDAIISLDMKNAFNTISRQHLFSCLGEHQRQFEDLFPYIQSHYGRHGELRVFLRGETHIIPSETGVHQGDPFGSTLFALGLHPLLIQLADEFPSLLIGSYADNVFLVAPLDVALSAASSFHSKIPAANLVLNTRESGLLCSPPLLETLQPPFSHSAGVVHCPNLTLPFLADGLVALGCPIGSDGFMESVASKLVADIKSELDALLAFPFHHQRTKIAVFGTNARFTYHSRCWPVPLLRRTVAQVDGLFDSFLRSSLPFLACPSNGVLTAQQAFAIRQIRLNLSYGGWGLRSHEDHLPAAVFSSIAEFLCWLRQRESLTSFLSSGNWLGLNPSNLLDRSLADSPSVLLVDFQWAVSQLRTRWSFSVCDRPSSSSAASPRCAARRRVSRPPSASIPSLQGIFHGPADQSLPRQHHISHFISARSWSQLCEDQSGSSRDRARLLATCRYEVPLYSPSSALSLPSSAGKSVGVCPRALLSLTCPHYLDNADFLDLEALFLGLPIPSLLHSAPVDILTAHGALGDYQFCSSSHAGHTRKETHDQLASLLAEFARRARFSGVQTAFSRIPLAGIADRPGARGDIFFPSGLCAQDPRQPFVLDVRLSHLFTHSGSPRSSVFATISREKNDLYRAAYLGKNIGFAPLPVSTFLGVGPEVCHLLHRIATVSAASEPDLPPPCSESSPASAPLVSSGVRLSRLLKELQFALAHASLARLRGRDGFISSSS
jgi:hypothetical protein